MAKRKKPSIGSILYYLYMTAVLGWLVFIWTEHPLLCERTDGTSRSLTGSVTLRAVFAAQEGAPWSDEEIAQAKEKLLTAAQRLEADAAAYGAELSLCIECHEADAPEVLDRSNSRPWVSALLDSAPTLPDASIFSYHDVPILILLNTQGRAFAHSSALPIGLEYAIVFSDDTESVIRHELLHLYGAADYYVHDDVQAAAESICPDSVMLDSSGPGATDSLTAYLVGWLSAPDKDAESLIRATKHVSRIEYDNARSENQYSGYGTISADDWTYTGELTSGTPNGYGVIRWQDGSVYEGEWLNGAYHGPGEMHWANGDAYTGTFFRGSAHGSGTITWADGATYTGDFAGGELHGTGSFQWPDGTSYIGDVVHGSRTGRGVFRWDSGDVYTGEFDCGWFSGQGVMQFADGAVYHGSFLNNQISGYGCMTYPDGSQSTGMWENGRLLTDAASD
ncbi:MAG: hypothetical protein IJ343_11510 [Clostridia bacterium]|nr:hypothetical protein [Clostridia bacterium]